MRPRQNVGRATFRPWPGRESDQRENGGALHTPSNPEKDGSFWDGRAGLPSLDMCLSTSDRLDGGRSFSERKHFRSKHKLVLFPIELFLNQHHSGEGLYDGERERGKKGLRQRENWHYIINPFPENFASIDCRTRW